jgi:[ribosomal protein S5]-alanine N-acetyltransferase
MRDTIETNRLTLRPFLASDATQVATLVGDWDVARMCARIPHPYAADDARRWFESQPKARAEGVAFTFAVSNAQDGVVGAISLERRKDSDPLTLGYWLGKPHWGRGYATEAGAAVLAHATEDLGLADFRSEHFEDNEPSGAVLRKLGFAYTGDVRAMHCLARGAKVPARLMKRAPHLEGGYDG